MLNLASHVNNSSGLNLRLGRELFSNPSAERDNCVVMVKHQDTTIGVEVDDLLRIDFTQTQVVSDGWYAITLNDGWIGYRFFCHYPSGLYVQDGRESILVTPEIIKSLKVIGKIKDIYRSTNTI